MLESVPSAPSSFHSLWAHLAGSPGSAIPPSFLFLGAWTALNCQPGGWLDHEALATASDLSQQWPSPDAILLHTIVKLASFKHNLSYCGVVAA